MRSDKSRISLSIALASVLVLGAGAPASAGFFDFLFGGPRQHTRPPEPGPAPRSERRHAPEAPQSERPFNRSSPRISGGSVASTYCVRTCDGRYFPIQRTSRAQATQLCNALCPASQTMVFFGSDIARATSREGKQYDDLENAFVYREKTVDNCTCNGHSPYGLATLTPAQDPTLRPGDLVATTEGVVKSAGAKAYGKASDDEITSGLRSSIHEDAQEKEKPRKRRSYRRDNFSRHDAWQ